MTALDTGTSELLAEIKDGVAVITMNRPQRRNAFSPGMISALGTVLAQVETDEAVGCVVLTGAAGAFSAGGDVKSMAAQVGGRLERLGPRRRHPPPAAEPAGHQRPPVEHAQADDRRHRRAPRPAPACPWRWPATCATRCRGPS